MKKVTIICQVCKQEFKARDARTKSCSQTCRNELNRIHRREFDARHSTANAREREAVLIAKVVRTAWLKGDAIERSVIQAQNPRILFTE